MRTKNVLEYLENSCTRFTNKTAVIDDSGACTYLELLTVCQKIGTALACKITVGTPVAVLMEKSIPVLQAFFGIVYAGGYYVLLNPDLPEKRLGQIQKVLQASFVITDAGHHNLARTLFPENAICRIEELTGGPIHTEVLQTIRNRMIDTDPLYANFTSGSTGIPKGVMVNHRSVIDFIDVFTELFRLNYTDVFGNQAPFDFDVSVKDIYSSVFVGGTLVILPKRLFSNPKELLDWLNDRKITTLIWAVSALCLVSTFHGLDYRTPETVRNVLFSGEMIPEKHLRTWREHLPDAQFVNLYGPTEITCNCTYYILDKNLSYAEGVPIGRPFPNEHVFLLDSNDQEVKAKDVVGEICVRGTALALGYCRAPEQTAAAFTQNPLNNCYPELIYRTGDLGKYNDLGELMFCGRKDFQIKYMGHRIELEEIERVIGAMPDVERCCCIFDPLKSKLYGFYVGLAEPNELRRWLQQELPLYMVPGALRQLPELPLNKNGKIDRKRLLERKE